MKLSILAAAALLAGSTVASANAEAAPSYPHGSLARRLYEEVWGQGAFGGKVGQQEWPEGGSPKENNIDDEDDEDTTTTVTVTTTKTVTKTRKHTATPAPVVKRNIIHESDALSPEEESEFLNDIFSLNLFQAGTECNPSFQKEVCSGNAVLICSESHKVWEQTDDCSEKNLKCGATAAQDGSNNVTIMCLSK